MQPPKSSICVICGIRPATTSEHLPPRGFFKGIVVERPVWSKQIEKLCGSNGLFRTYDYPYFSLKS